MGSDGFVFGAVFPSSFSRFFSSFFKIFLSFLSKTLLSSGLRSSSLSDFFSPSVSQVESEICHIKENYGLLDTSGPYFFLKSSNLETSINHNNLKILRKQQRYFSVALNETFHLTLQVFGRCDFSLCCSYSCISSTLLQITADAASSLALLP